MVRFRGFQEIVLSMLEQLQLSQPQLDTKPGTVTRDLFIDAQAQQNANIHEILRDLSDLQSIANLTGEDLTNFGFNFGVSRKTGTKANGTVLLTFRSLSSDVNIPIGSVVSTRNGITFSTISNTSVRTTDINSLRATATRFREDLDVAGISDTLAIEITVEAQSPGSLGNVATYSITRHNISGVNGITNITSFNGGSNLETDAAFRSRVLSRFAGANTGTALGYRSLILGIPDSVDALVIEPGDPLMIRDGSIITTDSNGNLIVAQPGTGGRVDIYVLGENLQSGTDSFVYKEQSGTGDATNQLNDFILGQSSLTPDEALTINSRRLAVLSEGNSIPKQPVSNIVSVSGSLSGTNFVEQYQTSGNIYKGNYKLVKDSGSAGGSPFGLDKLVWTSNIIELNNESRTKGIYNGIDGLSFTDVQEIVKVLQDTRIINENSRVSTSSRNVVILKHGPVRNVSRVFNLSTGERYTITDQNPDGNVGELNTSKHIEISGRTLPTASDILQVDYIWVRDFDSYIDFDSFNPKDPLNSSQDSIDWGFSNYIRDERVTANLDSYGNLSVITSYPVSRILSINTFVEETNSVSTLNNVKVINGTSQKVTNVHKIIDITKNNAKVFKTKESDGNFSNNLITLPSDTIAESGDSVSIIYSLNNIVNSDGYDSISIIGNKITIFPSNVVSDGTTLLINYVADFLEIIPQTDLSNLPIIGNGYNSFSDVDGYQPVQDLFSGTVAISNKRKSPTQLEVSILGVPTEGLVEIIGTTFNKVEKILTATSASDLKVDVSILIKDSLGISRTASLPIGIYIGKVALLQKITTDLAGNITSYDHTYDLTNYSISNNRYDLENALKNTSLSNYEFLLSSVSSNVNNPITTGTKLRLIFYYVYQNDSESLFFSKAGSLITDKVFAKVGSINRASGFTNSVGTVSGNISIDSLNQPDVNSAYLVDYSYQAPKENERITINYEYNKLIQDATFAIEEGRPITSDVLVKQAVKVEIDVIASIVVLPSFQTSEESVRQDVADNIAATLNSGELGSTLDASDIINNAYNVGGLDRIIITKFNKSGVSGTKNSIAAQKNEYLAAGDITVTAGNR